MSLAVDTPPQPVQSFGGFDYVTIDQTNHRVYAAHTRSERLTIVDSKTGLVTGQVEVGPMHGSAVDPSTGDVFTGNGTDETVTKVDPVGLKVLATANVTGSVDDIAYDPVRHRVYADEDGGGYVWIIDGNSMKVLGSVNVPGGDLEGLAVDPNTGLLYQNLSGKNAFAIIDGATKKVLRVVKTPQLARNHPLVFSSSAKQVITGGVNGVLSAYALNGKHIGDVAVQPHIDQCSTGDQGRLIACAGRGIVSVIEARPGAAPSMLGQVDTGHEGIHTVGIDESTGDVWVVWSDDKGDWVQRLKWTP